MSNFHLFLLLLHFFKCYAMLMWCQEHMTYIVIHQTKPIGVVVQHAKGLHDWSTYKGDNRHLKRSTNFGHTVLLTYLEQPIHSPSVLTEFTPLN